jgi:hypothetical protein
VLVAVRTPFFTAQVACCAPFSRLARGQTGSVDIEDQESVSLVVVSYCLAFASGETTERFTSRLNIDSGETIEGLRHGGWLGTVLQAPRLCSCCIRTKTRIDLTDGMTTAHHADEASEQLVIGCVEDALLLQVKLFSQRGQEITLLQALPESCSRRERRVMVHL